MIYQMSLDLEAGLQTLGYPVRVSYGPERLTRSAPESYEILVARDVERGDGVDYPSGSSRNPRRLGTRTLGVSATFFACSPLPGAQHHEHERACDDLVDAFICQLYEWQTEAKAGPVVVKESRYLTPLEYSGAELLSGVVYRVRFDVQRGLYRRDYGGSALPAATVTSTSNTIYARVEGGTAEEV